MSTETQIFMAPIDHFPPCFICRIVRVREKVFSREQYKIIFAPWRQAKAQSRRLCKRKMARFLSPISKHQLSTGT